MAAITLATVGIAFVSFARKVDSFSNAGFTYDREAGALLLRSVEAGGAAARAGLSAGDRIVLVDGQTAASISNPEKALGRKPFPHRLVVITAGEVRGVSVGAALGAPRRHLPVPRLRRLPLPGDRPLHDRPGALGAGDGLLGALPRVVRRLRHDSGRAAGHALEARLGRRGRVSGVSPGAPSALLPDLPAADPRPPRPAASLPAGARLHGRRGHAALDDAVSGRRALPRRRHAVLVRLLRRLRRRRDHAARARRAAASPGRRGREAGALDRSRRDRGIGAVSHPLGPSAGLRPRIAAALDGGGRAARADPPGLRVRHPQVAPVGRRDLRPRGDRHDGRRASRRHDVRPAQLAPRPHARGHGRRGQERHRVRVGARAGLTAGSGQETHHRRARAHPVPRHLPGAPRAPRHRPRLRRAAAARRSRPCDCAAGRGGSPRRALLALPLRGTRPGSRRRGSRRGSLG